MEVTLDVKYEMGHSYKETWERGELFCPGCGKQGVWEEQSGGDYYTGSDFLCPSCGANFTIQFDGVKMKSGTTDVVNWQDEQRRGAILAVIKEEGLQPATNKGSNLAD